MIIETTTHELSRIYSRLAASSSDLSNYTRQLDRMKIDMAHITARYLQAKGFLEHQTVSRDILNKRTPPRTSIVKDAPVESMCKEYVLIYKKPGLSKESSVER